MSKRYRYKGFSSSGQAIEGEVAAASEAAALEKAYRSAEHVVSVHELVARRGVFGQSSGRKVPLRTDIQQLSTMLKAGMPLAQAVQTLAQQERSHSRAAAGWIEVADELNGGASTHVAIQALEAELPSYMLPLIKAGEASGDLAGAFASIHQQLEAADAFSSQVRNAMIYPVILFGVGLAVALLMIVAVIPNFVWLLEHKSELPALSYWIIASGDALRNKPESLLYIAIAATSLLLLKRLPAVNQAVVSLLAQLPIIGPWRQKAEYTGWFAVMATLLERKISLAESLKVSEACCGEHLASAVRAVREDISAGKSLADAVTGRLGAPVMVANLIATGERAGALESIFASLAADYQRDWEQMTERVLKLTEPMAIILIGGLLGTMMIGILLGITSATSIGI